MPVDLEQATAFVRTQFADADAVVALPGGLWSDAYAFRAGRDDLVIRFGAHRSDYEKDRLAAAYATAALPIPAVIAIRDAFEGSFAISQRVFGTPLDALDEQSMRRALPSIFATTGAMRDAD